MDENIGCIVPIIVGVLLFLMVCGVCFAQETINKRNEPMWNDGVCPKCSEIYELKAVDSGKKFYACNECGQEVVIY